MIRVSNKRAVLRLALRSFLTNRLRNIFAILAMILTSVLFTSLFTAVMGLNTSFEQQTMRMVGGYSHGNFKYLTKEQAEILSKHNLVKEYGMNLFLSSLYEGEFAKHTSEIRYFDKNSAKMFYSYPTVGTMPVDKYDLATDTVTLKQLGLKPSLGEKLTITYPLDSQMVTDTFTLCGYWETDTLTPASQILLSKKYVEEKLTNYQEQYQGDPVGKWDLEIMFRNSLHIEENLKKIAEDNGYQIDDFKKNKYLDYGVNWGYTSAQMDHDNTMVLSVAAIAVIIILAGYLIIYNIFLISVTNDIRFYGLLKTIGTTGRQIKRIIRYQALLLTVIGIPFGLFFGYLIGSKITTVIMASMSNPSAYQSTDPRIFLGAAAFTILTVLISIRKPGRVAAKVTPIEAVRYTDREQKGKKAIKKSRFGARIYRMAISNLLRNKKKTAIVIISLSLSITLLNAVFVFTSGFDVNKMVSKSLASDFVLSSANYFNTYHGFRDESDAPSENYIKAALMQEGVKGSGFIYYDTNFVLLDFTPEMIKVFGSARPDEMTDNLFFHVHGKNAKDGMIQLYGMDNYALNKLKIVEGTIDIDKLKSGKYILEVVDTDDYDKILMETKFYHPGDQVTLDYIDELNNTDREKSIHHQKTYEVMAVVKLNTGMSVRHYYLSPVFILPSDCFISDTGIKAKMSCLVDVEPSREAAIEQFLKRYTSHIDVTMSYSSKDKIRSEFVKYLNMFRLIGNSLSLILGVIGILNYMNVVLTGIITRKKELSILKSIGMTGKQQITLLVLEGFIYTGLSILISTVISAVINVTLVNSLGSGLWFFTAHFSLLPVLIVAPFLLVLSLVVPCVVYYLLGRESLVDQLRVQE